MTSTEEEINTCQNNDVCLRFQHPGALLHCGLSVCSKKNCRVLALINHVILSALEVYFMQEST